LLGENHLDVANSLNNLGSLYYYQERYFEAESLFLQALEVSQKGLRLEHPEAVNSRKNLAIVRDRLNSTATDLPNFNHKAKKGGSKKKSKGFGKG
jgi:tetratricopeptide (TPR) repeat protein